MVREPKELSCDGDNLQLLSREGGVLPGNKTEHRVGFFSEILLWVWGRKDLQQKQEEVFLLNKQQQHLWKVSKPALTTFV